MYSQATQQKIQYLAILLFSKEEIEEYISLDEASEIDDLINKGTMSQEVEIRKALYTRAKEGNIFAIKEWNKLKEQIDYKNKKRSLRCQS